MVLSNYSQKYSHSLTGESQDNILKLDLDEFRSEWSDTIYNRLPIRRSNIVKKIKFSHLSRPNCIR